VKKPQKSVPLKLRLKAWWEGYDQDDIAKRLAEREPDAPVAEKPKKTASTEPVANNPETESGLEVDPWDDDKVNVNQYIWGPGFCGPGGPDYIVQLSKLMALSPEMSMLQIGASIGGPARVLADKFGVWITGYEQSETLVNAGNELSIKMGMEKKAEIIHYNPETVDDFGRKFDRAISKEAMFTIKNKKNLISCIEEKLKPGGLILMTDYVLGSEATVAKDSYKEWKVGERTEPFPVLAEELEDMFKKVHMQVRVSEDITDTYVSMINGAWAGADAVAAKLAREPEGSRLIQVLMREAEFWTRRKKLLESGDIRLWRIVANKKASGPSMMSDW